MEELKVWKGKRGEKTKEEGKKGRQKVGRPPKNTQTFPWNRDQKWREMTSTRIVFDITVVLYLHSIIVLPISSVNTIFNFITLNLLMQYCALYGVLSSIIIVYCTINIRLSHRLRFADAGTSWLRCISYLVNTHFI